MITRGAALAFTIVFVLGLGFVASTQHGMIHRLTWSQTCAMLEHGDAVPTEASQQTYIHQCLRGPS